MPIKIPASLPARAVLEHERVPLILEEAALRQDIRPLRIALLNLMPDKIKTETQLLRALGATPLQIEMTFLHTASHASRNTAPEHLENFYKTHADIRHEKFDAMIITGAPVGKIAYEDVTYWRELAGIFDWADTHVHSTLFICWGAQTALYHHHGLSRRMLPEKCAGVYPQTVLNPFDPLVRGFDDVFQAPVSRNAEVAMADLRACPGLDILAASDDSGACIAHDAAKRRVYVFNHLEYEFDTLKLEYDRDVAAGLNPALPENYFPAGDPAAKPAMTWRAHRVLLFGNWVNMVYQSTPYRLEDIGQPPK